MTTERESLFASQRRPPTKKYRPALTRSEVAMLIDALDALEEEYEYHGGTILIADELALRSRLKALIGMSS